MGDACLAVSNCASAQSCALSCACSDNACILKCAASSPSIKALPVAKCINSNCGSLNAAATGGKLALTWEDCGDASTHGKTETLEPSEIVIGQDTQIVGTGTTDKAISSGSFSMKLTAGMGIKETYTGEICEAKEFKMPLGIGTVSWAGMSCPVAVGPSTVKVGVHMASILPAALAKADLSLTAQDQDGEAAVCVNTHLVKKAHGASLDIDCSTAACPDQCSCSLDKCASEIDACLAIDNCASSQDCALQCPCSDNACMLKCAASSPSIKALPVAKCVNSQCGNLAATPADIDCTTATCQSQCECSLDKCASQISACLADAKCAAAQSCALACPCSDNACMLKCAASNPSAKALPVAT